MTDKAQITEKERLIYERNAAEHQAAEKYDCSSSSCNARVGEPCRTKAGELTYHPHKPRQKLSAYQPAARPAVSLSSTFALPGKAEAGVSAAPVSKRDVFRQALDLRDKPRSTEAEVLIGAAIDGALGRIDITELATVLRAAQAVNRSDDEPPF